MPKKTRYYAAITLILLSGIPWQPYFELIPAASAAQTIPKLLNYQARITSATGTAVANGSLSVKFTIYDAATSGTCRYTTRGTCGTPTAKTVTVTNGVFSTLLGDTTSGDNAIPDDLFDTPTLYLGITVATDSEMVPRKRLSSAPYAFNADRLDNLDTSATGGLAAFIPVTSATGSLTLSAGLTVAGTGSFGNLIVNGTCTGCGGGGGSTTLQQAYDNSVSTTEIAITAARGPFTVGGTFASNGTVFEVKDASQNRILTASATSVQIGQDSWIPLGVGTSNISSVASAHFHWPDGNGNGIVLTDAGTGAGDSNGGALFVDGASGAFSLLNNENLGPILFYTNTGSNVERMRISGIGNVGIGNLAPANRLTVGTATSTFEVNQSGNLVKINNVVYSWPSTQGGASTILTNNGSGLLTWAAAGGGSTTLQQSYDNDVNGGDVTITMNATDGDLILAGDQDFRTTTTGLTVFGNNTHTTTNPVTINASTLTSGTLLTLTGGNAMAQGGIISATGTVQQGSTNTSGMFELQANMTYTGSGFGADDAAMLIKLNDIPQASANSLTHGYDLEITSNSFFAHTQRGYRANLLSNTGSPTDTAWEAMFFANNADTATGNQIVVTNGYLASVSGSVTGMTNAFSATPSAGTITNGFVVGSTGTVTNGINFTGATTMTTDFIMQNGESLDNNVDGTINTVSTFQVTPPSATANGFVLAGSALTSGIGVFLTGGNAMAQGGIISATGTVQQGSTNTSGMFELQANMTYTGSGFGADDSGILVKLNDIPQASANSITHGYDLEITSNSFTAHTQRGYRANLLSNTGSPTDTAWEAMFFANNADTATGNQIVVTNGYLASVSGSVTGMTNAFSATPSAGTITNGFVVGSTGTVTNGINFTGATTMTTDFIMQNGESLDNNTDGTINTVSTFQVTPPSATANGFVLAGSALTSGIGLFLTGGNAMAQGAIINATGTVQQGSTDTSGMFELQANMTYTGSGFSANDAALLIKLNDIPQASANSTTNGIDLQITSNSFTAHTQRGIRTGILANSGSPTDATWENLILLDNADTATGNLIAVTDALLITNSGAASGGIVNAITIGSGSQPITTALNIASTGVTTDLRMQNGEVMHNDTDGTIAFTDGTNTLCTIVDNGTTGSLTCTGPSPASTLQQAYNNSTTPEITLDTTRRGLTIRDTSTPLASNLFEVMDFTQNSSYFYVSATGAAVGGNLLPTADNTYDLGSTALRWKTLHTGPGSVVVHNDATDTEKVSLGFVSTTPTLFSNATVSLTLDSSNGTVALASGDSLTMTGNFSVGGGVVITSGRAAQNLTGLVVDGSIELNRSSGSNVSIGDLTASGTITVGNTGSSNLILNDPQWAISGAGTATLASLIVDTSTLAVDATNNRVGIGDASPENFLDVEFSTTGVGSNTGLTIVNNSTGDAAIDFAVNGAVTPTYLVGIDNSNGDRFMWRYNATDFDAAGGDNTTLLTIDGVQNRVCVGLTFCSDAMFQVIDTSAEVMRVNRDGTDGIMVSFYDSGFFAGDISNSGTTISYNAFTGSHYGWTDEKLERGMLVGMTGENRIMQAGSSEPVYGIVATSEANGTTVLGSFLGLHETSHPYSATNTYLVMSVGNGDMWVVDGGQNVGVGDYLISSDVAGHAMKDPGTYAVSHVVARATEIIDWSTVTKSVGGKKRKKINVTFEVFDKNAAFQAPPPLAPAPALVPAAQAFSASSTPSLAAVASLISSNGLWSISDDGRLIVREVETQLLKTEGVMVVQSASATAISEGKVLKGKTSVVIKNGAMKKDSKVFVSFLADSNGNYWITDKGDGTFTLRLKSAPKKDLPFEYWIIGVDDKRTKP